MVCLIFTQIFHKDQSLFWPTKFSRKRPADSPQEINSDSDKYDVVPIDSVILVENDSLVLVSQNRQTFWGIFGLAAKALSNPADKC